MTILQMSLTGGIFIAMVLLLRLGLQNYVTRRVFPALWLVANALLLIPIRISSPTSVYNLPPHQAAAELTQPLTQMTQKAQLPVAQATGWTAERIFTLVWLCGAALVMGLVLANHIRARRRYRFSLPFENPPDYVPKRVRVRILDGLASPLTYGILRPVILLPVERPDERQLEHMLRHELCHIRHMDVLRKLLMLLACALHWFNPMVWLMLYVAGQDMEMRCDALVIRRLGRENRSAYARTLVHYEIRQMQNILDTGFSYSSINSRLQAILKAKRIPVFSTALAVALLLGTVTVFATGATTKEPERQQKTELEQTRFDVQEASETQIRQQSLTATESQAPMNQRTEQKPDLTDAGRILVQKPMADEQAPDETPNQPSISGENQKDTAFDVPETTPEVETPADITIPDSEPTIPDQTTPQETQIALDKTEPDQSEQADSEQNESPENSKQEMLPRELTLPSPGKVLLHENEGWTYHFSTDESISGYAQNMNGQYVPLDVVCSSGTCTITFYGAREGNVQIYLVIDPRSGNELSPFEGNSRTILWATLTIQSDS